MTGMRDHLLARMEASGPMTVADYMADCLLHPTLGYYTTRDPLGAAGDFTTAPEISQMFGELVGLSLAQYWIDLGSPAPFTLAELGPGRGTMMTDALRATRSVPGFHEAAQLVLVETSPALRAEQARALAGYDPQWQSDLSALPDQPLFLIANEFFDALPIRQFIRSEDGWSERVIAVDASGALAFGLTAAAPLSGLARDHADAVPGDLVETCAPATALVGLIGDHIARAGGLALIIDYGGTPGRGDTFQALRGHQKASPLADPGQADLTAHVDFVALSRAMPTGVRALPPLPQGVFLERLGITARAQALAANLTGDALQSHVAAHRRLTHPEEMGDLFKVMAIIRDGQPMPPGIGE